MALVRVKATEVGFYDQMRKVGDIFNVKERHANATWYAPVGLDGKFNKPETEDASKEDEDSGLDENDELDLEDEDTDLIGDLKA